MTIDYKAPLSTRKEIFIDAAPETVWGIHTDINKWSPVASRHIPSETGGANRCRIHVLVEVGQLQAPFDH